jgi:hypothetical protein
MGQAHETDRYRTESGWMVECIQCGQRFESKRYDASFCSGACRTKRSREEEQLKALIEKTDSKLDELIEALKGNHPDLAFEAMKALKKKLDYAVSWESDERDFRRSR